MIETLPSAPAPAAAVNPVQLGAALARFFNLSEIELLCFDLNFEFEELGEGGRTTKAIRLVKAFEREGRLFELAEAVLQERPDLSWTELGQPAAPDTLQAAGEPPYKGLAFFDVGDADQFFGRETLTGELVTHLHHHPFLAVVGASGSGKSSIVRAGLIPALRAPKALPGLSPPPGSAAWPLHILTPTDDPLLSLATSLSGSPDEALALRAALAADSSRLKLAIQFKLRERGADRLLLFVDQFEETFTQCKDEDVRRAFIDNLVQAAAGAAVVVITLRADYYAACAAYENLREILSHQQVYIGPMNRDELRSAIEKPAERADWRFENGLVDLLLDDLGAGDGRVPEPGALPLLSHALLETWKRREGVTLTLTGYIASGGIRGAIAQTAEEVYEHRLRPEQRALARRIFLRLTEIGETAQDTRRRAGFSELINRSREEEAVEAVLLILAEARLVTVDQGEDESDRSVQVTHEALIREWPQLRAWLDSSRERLRVHRQITADTRNWIRLKRDAGALYRGARLAQAVEWLRGNAPQASRVEREFIQSGRDAAEAEEREREAIRQRELAMARDLAQSQARSAARLRWMLLAAGGAALALLGMVALLASPVVRNWRDRQAARGESVAIPAGPVILGTDDPEWLALGFSPLETIHVDPFAIDRREVSNRQYALCVRNDACTIPIDPTEYNDPARLDHPATSVTVYQAMSYCRGLGRRLPTAAEWERAARGPDSRSWPWGDGPPTALLANMPIGDEFPAGTLPVDSLPAGDSGEGVSHLIGNVWEWTRSYVRLEERYDPANVWDGSDESFKGTDFFVQKGGSWMNETEGIFADLPVPGFLADSGTGFRCVRPALSES